MSLVGSPPLDASLSTRSTSQSARAPLVMIAGTAAAGIVVDRVQSDWLLEGGPLVVGCAAWWWAAITGLLLWYGFARSGRPACAAALLLATFACMAAGWHHWSWNLFESVDLGRLATDEATPCCVEAFVLASPERIAAPSPSPFRAIPIGEKSRLPLRITKVRNGQQWQVASGRCTLVVDGHLLDASAGDRLRVYCHLRRSSPPRNPGQFDYAAHARADRRLCLLRCGSPDGVRVIGRGGGGMAWRAIDRLRATWRTRLWNALGEEQAPMATALLLGARSALPRERSLPFKVSGAMHVLVVSGLHAGILVSLIFFALGIGFLPRRGALAMAIGLVAGYAMLTGAHPPVMRAVVLAELVCLALWFAKKPLALNSLAAAALVVLAMNPSDLFRTGPQLSFLCAAVLLWFSSVKWRRAPTPLEKLVRDARPPSAKVAASLAGWVATVGGATLAVWIVSLPLVAREYHLVTPVAVLVSPLLFLAVAMALLTGFAFLVVGWFVPLVAPLLASICGWSIGWLDGVVHQSSELPAGYFWTPGPAGWWVVGWFVLVTLLLRNGGTRWGGWRTLQVSAAWAAVGCLPTLVSQGKSDQLEVAFLDVGHGTSVVITTLEGTTLLYDAGSIGSPDYATETIASYLWSRGIRSIDGLVLSHADVDHFNAVPGLLERFPIGSLFVTPMMFPRSPHPQDHSAPAELRRILTAQGVPVKIVLLGDRLTIDSTTYADVFYPDRLGNLGSDNANSMVLAIEHRGHRVLLPGDLESPGIEAVMADEPYDCDVLLAPHHGSRRSDPLGFSAWSTPEWVVVSGRGDLGAEEVAASYRSRGARVLTTGQTGAIEFSLGKGAIQMHRFLLD